MGRAAQMAALACHCPLFRLCTARIQESPGYKGRIVELVGTLMAQTPQLSTLVVRRGLRLDNSATTTPIALVFASFLISRPFPINGSSGRLIHLKGGCYFHSCAPSRFPSRVSRFTITVVDPKPLA